jgi:histidinol-phosphate aminotransferase
MTLSDIAPTRPHPKAGILDIAPYVAGKAKAAGHAHPLKLSANENVLGSSPRAVEAYAEAAGSLALYPDPRSDGLREAVAQKYGLEPERLIFGCGSDEIFTLLGQTFLEPGDNAVQGEFGFFAYRIAIRAAQGQVRFAAQPGLRIDIGEILSRVDDRTRLVFLDNPGNPTGAWIKRAEVEALHAQLPANCILVLDGAYAEFCDDPDWDDGRDLARRHPNVMVTRTFSKIFGLAGLRVGWAYGDAEVISAMDRIRAPFNVNLPAQAACVAGLADEDFIARSQALVRQWRPWLAQQLGGLGLEVPPSQGNFVLPRFPDVPGRTAAEAEAFLSARGILVRGLANYGIKDALRITIGLEAHNRAVVDALAEFLGA